MFKRILVPVDGSRTAESGLRTAIRMARDEKAALILLHVVDENVLVLSGDYAGAAYIDRFMADMREGGRKIIAAAAAIAKRQGVTARTVLVESVGPRRVADVIVQQARKQRADAIVIGTHGRRGSPAWSWAATPRKSCAARASRWCWYARERAGESSRYAGERVRAARSPCGAGHTAFLPGRK